MELVPVVTVIGGVDELTGADVVTVAGRVVEGAWELVEAGGL